MSTVTEHADADADKDKEREEVEDTLNRIRIYNHRTYAVNFYATSLLTLVKQVRYSIRPFL